EPATRSLESRTTTWVPVVPWSIARRYLRFAMTCSFAEVPASQLAEKRKDLLRENSASKVPRNDVKAALDPDPVQPRALRQRARQGGPTVNGRDVVVVSHRDQHGAANCSRRLHRLFLEHPQVQQPGRWKRGEQRSRIALDRILDVGAPFGDPRS